MRIYAPPENWEAERVLLPEEEAHHIKDVLRLKQGAIVEVFDGRGKRCDGIVGGNDALEIELADEVQYSARSFQSFLVQAVPKAKRMDVVVEKATELGVAAIVPFISDRTVVKLTPAQACKKLQRWRRIAISAAKQSGVNLVPAIDGIVSFDAALGWIAQKGSFLIGSLEPGAEHIRTALRSCRRSGAESVGILIGPEGDFSPREMKMANEAGAVSVAFGSAVLRTDTAAIYALSAITYEFSGR